MHHTVSIRTKLTSYFLAIVGLSGAVSVMFVVLHVLIVDKYRQVEDNIFLQYSLIGATSALVSDYNVYRSTTSPDDLNTYLADKNTITSITKRLDETIVQEDSRSLLSGVENTIANILGETDAGVASLQGGDLAGTLEHYTEAYRKFSFAQENITDLILKEVGYGQALGAQIDRTNEQFLAFSGLLIVISFDMLLFLSLFWSRTFVSPLTKLSELAKLISDGDIEKNVEADLTQRGDEFGSLANSFNVMIANLRKSMDTLTRSNKDIESKNGELEHLNKFMIDRELKMIELKKRIAVLEGTKPEGKAPRAPKIKAG